MFSRVDAFTRICLSWSSGILVIWVSIIPPSIPLFPLQSSWIFEFNWRHNLNNHNAGIKIVIKIPNVSTASGGRGAWANDGESSENKEGNNLTQWKHEIISAHAGALFLNLACQQRDDCHSHFRGLRLNYIKVLAIPSAG